MQSTSIWAGWISTRMVGSDRFYPYEFMKTQKCIREYSHIDSNTVRKRNSDAISCVELAEEAGRIAEKEIRI